MTVSRKASDEASIIPGGGVTRSSTFGASGAGIGRSTASAERWAARDLGLRLDAPLADRRTARQRRLGGGRSGRHRRWRAQRDAA